MADGDQETGDWAAQLAEAAGEGAAVGDAFGVPVFDVPSGRWVDTLRAARDAGLTFFDWLSAVDEMDEGFAVVAHLADMSSRPVLHLLVRTRITRDAPSLRTATSVYRGAAWHERETHEMFGIDFDGHPGLTKLLLPDEFEGHPLRKEFVLAARAAKPWPGAKEPGEGGPGAASPSRRRMQPPGVPDPSWGPRPPGQPADASEGDAPDAESAGGAEVTGGGAGAETGGKKAAAKKASAKKTSVKKTSAKKSTAKKTTKTAAKTTKKATTKKAAGKKATGGAAKADGKTSQGGDTGGAEPGGDAA